MPRKWRLLRRPPDRKSYPYIPLRPLAKTIHGVEAAFGYLNPVVSFQT
jgi:hypothetical protein